MSCWDVLERRAKVDRDRAADMVSEARSRLQEQQALCDRTQEIAEQYQRKIEATQPSATHFGDIQLYRTSLKQMLQAVAYIRTQITALEMELTRKRRELIQAEIERQKYQRLIEREKERAAEQLARREARELDEIGGQLHYRKSKLA